MIRVTLAYTDNLGPEADIPALLGKIATRLGAHGAPLAGEHVLVCGLEVAEFVRFEGDWATLQGRIAAPPELAGAFVDGLLDELLGIAERHLAELLARRSIALSFDLETPLAAATRLRPRPPTAPAF